MTLPLFPVLPGLTWPVTRTNLGFDVDVLRSLSGLRSTFPSLPVPTYRWSLSFEFLRTGRIGPDAFAEFEALEGFYNRQLGRAYAFAYAEPADGIASAERFGTGDGTSRQFQLCRSRGGFVEPVRAPLTASVLVNGATADPSGYSVSDYGRVTFAAAPAANAALTWSGTYAWLCRFDDDSVDFQAFMKGYWSASKLTFSSEHLP